MKRGCASQSDNEEKGPRSLQHNTDIIIGTGKQNRHREGKKGVRDDVPCFEALPNHGSPGGAVFVAYGAGES